MRRSRAVSLAAVSALAAAFVACGDDDTAYCVDQDDRITENRYCDDDRGGGAFFWYFGGVGNSFRPGSRLSGGEKISSLNKAALAQRGGFGSSARSSGVGRGVAGSSSGSSAGS